MSEVIGSIVRDENGMIHVIDEDDHRLDLESTVTLADRLMPVRPVYLYFATFDKRDDKGLVKCKYGVTDNLKRRQRQLDMKFVATIACKSRYEALKDEKSLHMFLTDNGVDIQNEYFEAWIPLMIYIKRMILGFGGKIRDTINSIDDYIISASNAIAFPCVDCDDYCYPYRIDDNESTRHIVRTSLDLKYVYKCHACGATFSLPTLVHRESYQIANAYGLIVPRIDITYELEVRHSKTREEQIKRKPVRRVLPLAHRSK